ncbi:MAG: hypothetical protein A2Y66_01115 [Nitrospirae bacterium RBG_13_41_22]|nr:MAG: hypothetical protein A2Y66_01115 [Nitrospirae bacterium RBG_13_41_22]
MNTHWTARSTKDFLFRIAADFIAQLEDKMESPPLSRNDLAKKLGVTKGRVSQIFNNPGNITLEKIVEYSRALKMKVAIVAYEDNDPENKNGPVNSEIFKTCWEKSGRPREFWDFQEVGNGLNHNQALELAITDRGLYRTTGAAQGTSATAQVGPGHYLPIRGPIPSQLTIASQV